jgi:aminopeptidase N
MIVGSEETDHIWMDEGLVTYLTRMGTLAFWGDEVSPWAPTSGYFNRAGTARETEPMRHGDLFPSVGALVTASYDKTSRILYALRGIVGAEAFDEAFRTYAERWAYKHPYPYDLFNTFESVLGRELDWFWRPLLYTTRTLDHAVASVEQADDGVTVTVEDQGRVPMPVPVQVTYADGTTQQKRIPVAPWLAGKRTATVSFDAAGEAGPVERVTLDPDGFLPDVDRADNTWTPSD